MPAYRAVLFDFFGTLTRAVRRGPQHGAIARELGCDPTEMIAVLDRSFADRSRGAFGDAAQTLRWVCAQTGARPTADAVRHALAARVAAIQADTALRPDALPTLRALRRRGLRTAVISDCGHELPAFLPRLPVAPLLDTTVYSVYVGQRKPHPRMYSTACRRLNVAPEDCLYVGDGGSRELSGAAELGMTAVRLAAPDLAEHLVFDPEPEWPGMTIWALGETVSLVEPPALPDLPDPPCRPDLSDPPSRPDLSDPPSRPDLSDPPGLRGRPDPPGLRGTLNTPNAPNAPLAPLAGAPAVPA